MHLEEGIPAGVLLGATQRQVLQDVWDSCAVLWQCGECHAEQVVVVIPGNVKKISASIFVLQPHRCKMEFLDFFNLANDVASYFVSFLILQGFFDCC